LRLSQSLSFWESYLRFLYFTVKKVLFLLSIPDFADFSSPLFENPGVRRHVPSSGAAKKVQFPSSRVTWVALWLRFCCVRNFGQDFKFSGGEGN
jgi:hypothetical protein